MSRPWRRAQLACISAATVVFGSVPATAADDFGWSLYAELLQVHTRAVPEKVGTRVDYAGLRRDPRWATLANELGQQRPSQLKTKAERLAFWINAYNIYAMDLVVKGRPEESIKDLGGFFSPVWDKVVGTIDGKEYSLGEIEHAILRPMGEPRIHAAIVCASISCPDLRREPYAAEIVDEQLEDAFREFMGNREKGARLDREGATLTLSPILDWFEDDFVTGGGVLDFVIRTLPAADASFVRDRRSDLDIEYFDYDWRLNQ